MPVEGPPAGPADGELVPASGSFPPPIDGGVARGVARALLSRSAVSPSYRKAALQSSFESLMGQAEDLVADVTGLRAPTATPVEVTDRLEWVVTNVASFQNVVGPLARKIQAQRAGAGGGARAALASRPGLARIGGSVNGAQVGALLAFMSTRVLGQYDVFGGSPAEGGKVLFVGPNVVSVEERYGFPAEQFRLWLAVHEVTHRCQFTAVPWLGEYVTSLLDEGLQPLTTDPARVLAAARRALAEGGGRKALGDGGILALVASPEQLAVLRRIQALMSLLEGHGDATMDKAGAAVIPGAERFSRVLRERRHQATGVTRLLQRMLGFEAKLRQYEEGERFVSAVEKVGGRSLFDLVWRGPQWLPSLVELRDPSAWVARVGPALSATT